MNGWTLSIRSTRLATAQALAFCALVSIEHFALGAQAPASDAPQPGPAAAPPGTKVVAKVSPARVVDRKTAASKSSAVKPAVATAKPAITKTAPKPKKPRVPTLGDKINLILDNADAAGQSHIGIEVVDLKTGKELYERQSTRLFSPASTTKLFTTALALSRLGPQYRFATRIIASSDPKEGVLRGDLIFEGGGDPSLSDRVYPSQGEAPRVQSPIDDFADQIVAKGIRRITGDVAGDDTLYPWNPYPPGWAIDDAIPAYGAPVSALTVFENTIHLTVHPGAKAGDPAQISVNPPIEYYTIDNRIETINGTGNLRVSRAPGARQLLLGGSVTAHNCCITENLAIDDPALYAAQALYEALIRRGVTIDGRPVARHRAVREDRAAFEGVILARRESPPLIELIEVVDKVSQNLHAEIMLREVGRLQRETGTRNAGIEELRKFLAEIGIEGTDYAFEDGSGLSRLTMVTPDAQAKLLTYMYRSKYRDAWVALLPIAGVDGTLRKRFDGQKVAVHAKTGSLAHVHALAGYAESPKGMRAFSILVNQANYPAADVREMIDKIVLAILRD